MLDMTNTLPEPSDSERWADIPGHANYQASSAGRIRTLWTAGYRPRLGTDYRPCGLRQHRLGYMTVKLRTAKSPQLVHRLVLMAFAGLPPGPDSECRHLDGTRDNNAIDNLCWGTAKENCEDMDRHGNRHRGESVRWAKRTNEQILEVVRLRREGLTCPEIERRTGVLAGVVRKIMTGAEWSQVTGIKRA